MTIKEFSSLVVGFWPNMSPNNNVVKIFILLVHYLRNLNGRFSEVHGQCSTGLYWELIFWTPQKNWFSFSLSLYIFAYVYNLYIYITIRQSFLSSCQMKNDMNSVLFILLFIAGYFSSSPVAWRCGECSSGQNQWPSGVLHGHQWHRAL